MSETMIVEVFGGTCASSCATCGGSCSTGGSGPVLEREAEQLKVDLKNKYGETVEVRYIDTDQQGLGAYPRVSRAVQAGYNFPIVAVNGQPRLAGGVDFETVRKVLDEVSAKN